MTKYKQFSDRSVMDNRTISLILKALNERVTNGVVVDVLGDIDLISSLIRQENVKKVYSVGIHRFVKSTNDEFYIDIHFRNIYESMAEKLSKVNKPEDLNKLEFIEGEMSVNKDTGEVFGDMGLDELWRIADFLIVPGWLDALPFEKTAKSIEWYTSLLKLKQSALVVYHAWQAEQLNWTFSEDSVWPTTATMEVCLALPDNILLCDFGLGLYQDPEITLHHVLNGYKSNLAAINQTKKEDKKKKTSFLRWPIKLNF